MESTIFNLSNNIENILKKSTDFDYICTDILEDLKTQNFEVMNEVFNLILIYHVFALNV